MQLIRGQWLREFWLKRRDRLLTSQRFQRWVSSFPLTKPIAKRKARKLFDICAGFVYSQVLTACIQLNLFELLANGPKSHSDIAENIGLSMDATHTLLNAACSLDLLEKRKSNQYGLGELGAALLGNPGIAAMINHHDQFYVDLLDPVKLLKDQNYSTELSKFWSYSKSSKPEELKESQTAEYTQLMSDSMSLLAEDILASYSFANHKSLLDLGGGKGAFISSVCKKWPHLKGQLFDLPSVADQAKRNLKDLNLEDQVSTVGGNLFTSALPEGADVISLVRICHDHNDDVVVELLRKIFAVLPSNGSIMIAEPMAGTIGAKSVGDAYFGFYLLAMRSGRPRSPQELIYILQEVGFESCQQISTPRPLVTQILTAKKH